MDDHLGPFNMAQEFMAQANALRSALNQAGNVRDHEALRAVHVHHAQVRNDGGEMIIGDLGPCVGDPGKQGGFSHIGEADQTNIRDHFQLQQKLKLPGRLSRLGIFGGLHGAGGIMLVAVSALSTGQKHHTAVFSGHIRDDASALRLPDDGPFGNLEDDVLSVLSAAVALSALLAVPGLILTDVPEICQGVQTLVHLKDHVAPSSAVSAVGAAVWHIFFSAEGNMAVATLAASDIDSRSVCEHEKLLV